MAEDDLLRRCRNNNPSREALLNTNNDIEKAKYLQFIWSLSAYFSWWCLENLEVPEITFVDGDIYFYSSLDSLKDSVVGASVGIVEHRCPYNPVNGKYNVGIVYFQNDLDGYKCSTWWKNCMLLTDNEFYKTHGMCGDQKYLELFAELYDNVKVIDTQFGHLAPWNFLHHSYDNNQVVWNGKKQDLLYCHFSNFSPDFEKESYTLARRHGFIDPPNNFIKHISDKYYNSLKEANEKP
tara:strand:- start:8553 stop:9263 length:711 start_codon:yes stop_codon:yes gene_type:complete